ncbi:MAG TPA: DUF6152 family protein [Terriglobia bacterium]|nr:DUF6152 family protein [Terriglobia bacterium]
MRLKLIAPLMAIVLIAVALPVFAHHSFSAQYDANKPITLKGVVTRFEWTNPHARIFIDVTDENGKVTSWNLELGSPNILARAGWTRKALAVGDKVAVEGALAKDGSKMANARTVTLASGKTVFAGSSGGDTPTAAPPPAR